MDLFSASPYIGTRGGHQAQYVRKVQAALNKAVGPPGVCLEVDGIAGPATLARCREWKVYFGFPSKFCKANLTSSEAQWLFGKKKPSATRKLRAASRTKARAKEAKANGGAPSGSTMRTKATDSMSAWARSGQWVEKPANSNFVPNLSKLAKKNKLSTWWQEFHYPWCAYAAFLAARNFGGKAAKAGFAGKFNVAYVPDILNTALKNQHGLRVIPKGQQRYGDLAIINFDGGVPDHIGRYLGPGASPGTYRIVEGNTSPGNSGSQANGGGVYIRQRNAYLVQAFVRDE